MFKKNLIVFAVILITLVGAGCSSVKVANKFNEQNISQSSVPVANVISSNYGCFLFSCIPVVTGDSKDSNSYHLFQDTVTVDDAYSALIKQSNKLGATKTINVRSEEKWYSHPYSYGLVWTKEVEVSGDVIR